MHTARYASTIPWKTRVRLGAGKHELTWTPDTASPVGSYVMRLTIARGAQKTVLGGKRPPSIARQQAAVVRVLGVEASFLKRSYAPGEPMELSILADAPSLTLQFLHCGPETTGSERNDEMSGVPMGDPVPLDWSGKRSAPVTITVQTGSWPTGMYTARLTTDDGRVGYRPLRPAAADPRRGAAARRPPDEYVAGVQHVRPRRRRLGGHLVRGRQSRPSS